MVRKSRTAKIATSGCGKGYGENPVKGKVKQETGKIRNWMETHKA